MALINAATGEAYNPVVAQLDETPVELSTFDVDFPTAYIMVKEDADVTIVGEATASNTGYSTPLIAKQLYPVRVRRIVTASVTVDKILLFR